MKLLYKRTALAAHPTSIVFAFLGCLVVVPAILIPSFLCLAAWPLISHFNMPEKRRPVVYCPSSVTKKESVRGKYMLIISIQLFQLLIAVPSVFLRKILEVEKQSGGH